jgi:hypothetical protein
MEEKKIAHQMFKKINKLGNAIKRKMLVREKKLGIRYLGKNLC